MKSILKYFNQNKRDLLFYSCIFLNSLILFDTKYFPTQDGCSHAYNSNILSNVFFGDGEPYSQFFSINPELVPNWFTNFLMLILNSLLPFNVAEKIILLIYFISFPLLFKKLISYFNTEKTYLVFLVFPFTHFCVLYYGFFNFAFGLIFFFLGIINWLRISNTFSIKKILWFSLLLLSTYFSHIFAFVALVIFCLLNEFIDVLLNFTKGKRFLILKNKITFFLKTLPAFIIPAFLTFQYFNKRPSLGNEQYYKTDELNSMLLNGDIFKSYGGDEELFSKPLFYMILIVILFALIRKIILKINKLENFFDKPFAFFLFGTILVYFFYTKPNGDGYGGYISVRLALYASLIFIIWAVSVIKKERNFEILITICCLFLSFKLFKCKQQGLKWLNVSLKKFDDVSSKIKEGSIVAPIYWAADYNWLGGHFSNVIGAEKKLIILENYEASTGYFPTVWKDNNMPLNIWGDVNSTEVCDGFINKLNNYPFGKVDYVIVYGHHKNNIYNLKLLENLNQNFTLSYSKDDVFLYKKQNK